jgi:histidinol phosphatase-like enzyme
MSEQLAEAGARLDAIYYCPHDLQPACRCRKPAPGMLLDAARTHGLDLRASWMVGDSEIDIEAGKNAGCKTVRVLTEREGSREPESSPELRFQADIVEASLPRAIERILRTSSPKKGS